MQHMNMWMWSPSTLTMIITQHTPSVHCLCSSSVGCGKFLVISFLFILIVGVRVVLTTNYY